MRNLDPKIKRQEIIKTQLWNALQGDIIGQIRSVVDGPEIELQQRRDVAARGIKVTENVMPELYALLESVKFNLNFTDGIELYIQANNDINAFSYTSEDTDMPDVIIITSGMINIFEEDELSFILGHEIGHIIGMDRDIDLLYDFIYNDGEDDWEDNVPRCIRIRFEEYQQLAEYAADRYGYLGCMDLNASISSIYKFSAGVNLKKMNVDIDALTRQNYENVNYFINDGTVYKSTHPMHPYRIQALVEFAECKTQKALDENMEKLFAAIPGVSHTDLDPILATLLAAIGTKIATVDGKMDRFERDIIIKEMSCFTLEANKLMKQVLKSNIDEVIEKNLQIIKEYAPEQLPGFMSIIIDVTFADNVINKAELDIIMEFGHMFDMDDDDIYNAISGHIKGSYEILTECL